MTDVGDYKGLILYFITILKYIDLINFKGGGRCHVCKYWPNNYKLIYLFITFLPLGGRLLFTHNEYHQ